jgi:hypothetical protein
VQGLDVGWHLEPVDNEHMYELDSNNRPSCNEVRVPVLLIGIVDRCDKCFGTKLEF